MQTTLARQSLQKHHPGGRRWIPMEILAASEKGLKVSLRLLFLGITGISIPVILAQSHHSALPQSRNSV